MLRDATSVTGSLGRRCEDRNDEDLLEGPKPHNLGADDDQMSTFLEVEVPLDKRTFEFGAEPREIEAVVSRWRCHVPVSSRTDLGQALESGRGDQSTAEHGIVADWG